MTLEENMEAYGKLPEIRFATLFSRCLHERLGLLPAGVPLQDMGLVVDVQARTGQWVRKFAQHYPDLATFGLTRDVQMAEYGEFLARRIRLQNVLLYDNAHFDWQNYSGQFAVVRACFVKSLLTVDNWTMTLKEWRRICSDDGRLIWIEGDTPQTNSLAIRRIFALLDSAAGEQQHPTTITYLMGQMLSSTHWRQVQHEQTRLDCSYGTPLHTQIKAQFSLLLTLMEQAIKPLGKLSIRELHQLHREIITDLNAPNFICAWTITTIVAEKAVQVIENEHVHQDLSNVVG